MEKTQKKVATMSDFAAQRFLKCTVRPDWICMKVVPWDRPWKILDFLISLLNIWKNFKVLSRFIQKWIQPPACSDYVLYRILSSYWLAHFYLMKKSAKVLHYSGLDCGMLEFLQIFFSQAVIQRPIADFPAFLETGLAEEIEVCDHIQPVIPTSRRIRYIFVWSGSKLWGLFKNSRSN